MAQIVESLIESIILWDGDFETCREGRFIISFNERRIRSELIERHGCKSFELSKRLDNTKNSL